MAPTANWFSDDDAERELERGGRETHLQADQRQSSAAAGLDGEFISNPLWWKGMGTVWYQSTRWADAMADETRRRGRQRQRAGVLRQCGPEVHRNLYVAEVRSS